MSQVVEKRPSKTGAKAEDILRVALSSPKGLMLWLEGVGTHKPQKQIVIRGKLLVYRVTPERVWFVVAEEGVPAGTFGTESKESKEAFLNWINNVQHKLFRTEGYQPTIGPEVKFFSPR